MKKNSLAAFPSWFLPLALFLLAFFLRLAFIGKGAYHPDNLHLILQAQKTLATHQLQPYLTGYTLTIILATFFIQICQAFGWNDPVGAVNLMSVLFGSLAIPVFYFFCKKILDEDTAFFSSTLLLVLPLFWSLSTFGNSQTPALFFLFLGLTFLADFTKGNAKAFWASAISLGLSAACRPQDMIFLFLPISYFIFFLGNKTNPQPRFCRRTLLHLLYFWGLGAFTVALCNLPLLFLASGSEKPIFSSYRYSPPLPSPSDMLAVFLFNLSAIHSELNLLILAASLGGFLFLFKRNRPLFHFISFWFICILLGYLTLYHAPTSRYILLCLPPFILAAGYAFALLTKSSQAWLKRIAFTLFALLLISSLFRIVPVLQFRHENSLACDFARWVARSTEKDAIILCTDENAFITEYGKRETLFWPNKIPPLARLSSEGLPWLQSKLDSGRPAYITIPVHKIIPPSWKLFLISLSQNFRLKPINVAPFEWWQHSSTHLDVSFVGLYKIEPRQVK